MRRRRRHLVIAGLLAAAALAAAGCSSAAGAGAVGGVSSAADQQKLADANPNLDSGSSLGGIRAPDFTLTNQFGQKISLSAFRGKVIILAF